MNFGTPTPAFWAVMVVMAITTAGSAISPNGPISVILSTFLCTLVSYFAFLSYSGGSKGGAELEMLAFWGLLLVPPMIGGALVSVLLGKVIRGLIRIILRKSK
jgi:hypothetical protein